MSIPVKIRSHHLLCLQGFQGYGYSDEFTLGMRNLLRRFKSDPTLEFEVTADCDAICEPCPHRDGAVCQKDADADRRIKEIDHRVLEKIGLSMGHIEKAKTLLDFVNARLKTVVDVKDICGGCPWRTDCLWYKGREGRPAPGMPC